MRARIDYLYYVVAKQKMQGVINIYENFYQNLYLELPKMR